MDNDKKSAELVDPKAFFSTDRGERAYYEGVTIGQEVLLPLTRDGFEALLERVCGQFTPALPVDDSTRKVFSGWVHHIANEVNTTSIEAMGRILYKSVSNALTWTIDQEIKKKARDLELAAQAEAAMKVAEEKRERKTEKKGAKRVTMAPKKNEASQ